MENPSLPGSLDVHGNHNAKHRSLVVSIRLNGGTKDEVHACPKSLLGLVNSLCYSAIVEEVKLTRARRFMANG